MSPAAFRARLGISRRTLQRWQAAGRIAPAFRTVTGHARYTEEQVAAMRTVAADDAEPAAGAAS